LNNYQLRIHSTMSKLFSMILLLSLQHYVSAQEPTIPYSSPSEFTIGGITISGTQFLDPDILISLSGLKTGDRIAIPGVQISNAIEILWNKGLFTNVEIRITRTIGSRVFLDIRLQERARLSKFAIKGVKKSEADDIREKLNRVKGRVVTDNVKNTATVV